MSLVNDFSGFYILWWVACKVITHPESGWKKIPNKEGWNDANTLMWLKVLVIVSIEIQSKVSDLGKGVHGHCTFIWYLLLFCIISKLSNLKYKTFFRENLARKADVLNKWSATSSYHCWTQSMSNCRKLICLVVSSISAKHFGEG